MLSLWIPGLTWAQTSSAPVRGLAPLSAAPDKLKPKDGPGLFGESAPKKGSGDIQWRLGDVHAPENGGSSGRVGVGVGVGLEEGKLLETLIWGGGGAIAGAVAGPLGALVGGLVGAAGGMLVAIFVAPHNGPETAQKSRR